MEVSGSRSHSKKLIVGKSSQNSPIPAQIFVVVYYMYFMYICYIKGC